jgi:hypothetical protein
MSRQSDQHPHRESIATEPTIPAGQLNKSGLDFSRERPSLEEPSSHSTTWVIVGLVVLVALGFWWLTDRTAKPKAPASAVTSAAPAATAAAAPPKPAPAKPAVPKPAPPSTPAKAATAPAAPTPAAAPAPAATAAPVKTSAVKAPATETTTARAHHHKKKAVKRAKPVKLPRLPSPPPAD